MKWHRVEYDILKNLIYRTLTYGESNSVLVVGGRGSGKTTLVSSVLQDLQNLKNYEGIIINLSGLLQHNDKIALQEIAHQLKIDVAVEKTCGTYAENLEFFVHATKGKDSKSKSVILVIDEFDLFCTHKNQTLLYNLFDISQSSKVPFCIIGITCRLDVLETLEKRVKSRFSHRQIFLKPFIGNFDEFNSQDKKTVTPSKKLKTKRNNKSYGLPDDLKIYVEDSRLLLLHSLSNLELALVIVMKHIAEIYDGEAFNFEMVYRQYLKFIHSRSAFQHVERAVLMKSFYNLQSLELIEAADSKNLQKEYQLFYLRLLPKEIISALNNMTLPTFLQQWISDN